MATSCNYRLGLKRKQESKSERGCDQNGAFGFFAMHLGRTANILGVKFVGHSKEYTKVVFQ